LSGGAEFFGTRFSGDAQFDSAVFLSNASFDNSKFSRESRFHQATFKGFTTFANGNFEQYSGFGAVLAERAFSLAKAKFHRVPDFIQAHFAEAPRLDDLTIHTQFAERGHWFSWPRRIAKGCWNRVFSADPDLPARWRALRRLAIQGHDGEREQMFFANEIGSQRFVSDWPVPIVPWQPRSWLGFFRFWFGILYGAFSGYGRSVLRPSSPGQPCLVCRR
jgi:hypothetical protein